MKFSLRLFFGLMVLLVGCGQRHEGEPASSEVEAPTVEVADAAAATASSADNAKEATAEVTAGPTPETVVAPTRLLIYHADLRLRVASLPRASASLDSLIHRSGGYLSASTEQRADGEWRQALTIRVRPDRFAALMRELGGLGTVEEKKLTTDDVTAQHADISARLKTKRAIEQRYVALLAQAKKISEVLEVEAKIGEVREEIESTESRLKTLNDEVNYSTIALVCYQPIAQDVPEAPVMSFTSRIVDSFYAGWTLVTGLFIGVVAIWPFLLLGPLIWWLLHRWRRRHAA